MQHISEGVARCVPQTNVPYHASTHKPKLLDQLREALRSRHYSRRTEQAYCHWIRRYIHFHNVRHPAEMAEPEINAFLTHLAVEERSAPRHRTRRFPRCCFSIAMYLGVRLAIWAKSSAPASPSACPSS